MRMDACGRCAQALEEMRPSVTSMLHVAEDLALHAEGIALAREVGARGGVDGGQPGQRCKAVGQLMLPPLLRGQTEVLEVSQTTDRLQRSSRAREATAAGEVELREGGGVVGGEYLRRAGHQRTNKRGHLGGCVWLEEGGGGGGRARSVGMDGWTISGWPARARAPRANHR